MALADYERHAMPVTPGVLVRRNSCETKHPKGPAHGREHVSRQQAGERTRLKIVVGGQEINARCLNSQNRSTVSSCANAVRHSRPWHADLRCLRKRLTDQFPG